MSAAVVPSGLSDFASLDPLVRPRSVAVIGASDEPARIGGRPIAYMKSQGFAGTIYPVNPKRPTVQGLQAYPSVDALPEAPDVAIIAVPAALAIASLEDLGRKGCRAVICLHRRIRRNGRGRRRGAGPHDGGGAEIRHPAARAELPGRVQRLRSDSTGPSPPASRRAGRSRGRIGIASQSGAYGTHMFAAALDRGLGTRGLRHHRQRGRRDPGRRARLDGRRRRKWT